MVEQNESSADSPTIEPTQVSQELSDGNAISRAKSRRRWPRYRKVKRGQAEQQKPDPAHGEPLEATVGEATEAQSPSINDDVASVMPETTAGGDKEEALSTGRSKTRRRRRRSRKGKRPETAESTETETSMLATRMRDALPS